MSKPFTVSELRQAFLDFFAAKGCQQHPSASLVPENDPTILFTVAGMAQFKEMFLGRGSLPFSRAATVQKCIRTNDIMQVGRTPRHHTFFEMLGNFSFNDYFKRETIGWAWEFLTEVIGLDADRLSVSVHTIDDEAYDIWHQEIGLPESRIFRLGDGDNFWPADAPQEGPLGPGGCCSEIFWDFQTNDDPDDDLTKDSGRFVEVWNCVFPQFNVTEPKVDGRYTLEDLGRTNIDTGMGLERLACVVQGKFNNFDIDLLQIIVRRVAEVAGKPYVEGATASEHGAEQVENNVLLRRIADHVRAVTFCIADGALPSNTGRGYVVRRLIRRATLDIDKLGVEHEALADAVPAVVEAMGEAYPEISRRQDLAMQTLRAEEGNFRSTLRKGLEKLQEAIDRHRDQGASSFSGDDAFELFTTHGFPRELIDELTGAEGLPVDQDRYQERWDEFVRISNSKSVDVFTNSALADAKQQLGATTFDGYDQLQEEAKIRLLEAGGQAVDEAERGTRVRVALDRTPFYAESGGQVGDGGWLRGGSGADAFTIRVLDTQKDEGLFVHSGTVEAGTARPGPVFAEVDPGERAATAANHSATHLLHSALNAILGDHVEQQGSKVEPASLRFDFNHPQALTDAELQRIEDWVNGQIAADHAVETQVLPIDKAQELGAKMLFGEKYGDTVRVVTMGGKDISMEFCGGCHVDRTATLGRFRIIREEASSAGIRRIIAVAGPAARAYDAERAAVIRACADALGLQIGDEEIDHAQVGELARQFKVTADQVPERVRQLAEERTRLLGELDIQSKPLAGGVLAAVAEVQDGLKALRKQAADRRAQAALEDLDQLVAGATDIDGVALVAARMEGVDGKTLRQVGERLKSRDDALCAVLAAESGGKAVLLVAATKSVVERGVQAGALVSRLAGHVGGRGGGKPDLAQAGGPDAGGIDQALADAAPALREALGVGV